MCDFKTLKCVCKEGLSDIGGSCVRVCPDGHSLVGDMCKPGKTSSVGYEICYLCLHSKSHFYCTYCIYVSVNITNFFL